MQRRVLSTCKVGAGGVVLVAWNRGKAKGRADTGVGKRRDPPSAAGTIQLGETEVPTVSSTLAARPFSLVKDR
jgi:hypothetical protein